MKKHIVLTGICLIILAGAASVACVMPDARAQEENSLDALTRKVMAAKDRKEWYPALEDLTDHYFSGHKYDMYVASLKEIAKEKKELVPATQYFIALTRFTQLGYLEETQNWEEYFSKGNELRQELETSAQAALGAAQADDPMAVFVRYLLWRYHDGQKDAFYEKALADLLQAARDFAAKSDGALTLKDIAGQLYELGQKAPAQQIYALYVQKLVGAGTSVEQLRKDADEFYSSGNTSLARNLYDAFLAKAAPASSKEAMHALLVELAGKFSANSTGKVQDCDYAETLYQKIEALGGKDAFDEALLYGRAFNQEKAKQYAGACAYYQELLKRFALSAHHDEALYKTGIIFTYVLRDAAQGKACFEALAGKETLSPQVVAAIYQLGLLSQWGQETDAAKKYYAQVVEKSKDSYQETVALAKVRLTELGESKPIDYPLKAYLDACLQNAAPVFDPGRVGIQCEPFRSPLARDVRISSATYSTETGCLPVEIQYLWSGHIGSASPDARESSFATTFRSPGTKEINLLVISPAGTIDRNLDFVDVD